MSTRGNAMGFKLYLHLGGGSLTRNAISVTEANYRDFQ